MQHSLLLNLADKEITMNKSNFVQAVIAALLLVFSPFSLAADEPGNSSLQVVQLDINSANATAIAEALDGIGMVKAQEIVAYREMFGNFESIDELTEVKGVGAGTVEKNRHRIVLLKE